MWPISLSVSKYQLVIFVSAYAVLGFLLCHLFWHSTWRYCLIIIVPVVVIEVWRAIAYGLSIKGVFTVINPHQVYWRKQRWFFYCRPLFLPNGLFLNLRSYRDNTPITLLLFCDHTDKISWRRLCYLMRQTILNWRK